MNYQSVAYPWELAKHELTVKLVSFLNNKRKALKKKRMFRNKLGDLAASQFCTQGIRPDNANV